MSDQRKKRPNSGLRHRAGSNENVQKGGHNGNGRDKNSHESKYQRQQSYDRVRKIVQEEGREARNLITWSVPVEDSSEQEQQPHHHHHHQQAQHHNHHQQHHRGTRASDRRSQQQQQRLRAKSVGGPVRRHSSPKPPGGRGEDRGGAPRRPPSQSSLERSGSSRKGDLRARYWAFLFDNLRRAVDEIYSTCETDESVVECKEVIMMLEQCTKDFKSLIERLNLLRDYENADVAKRPTSLAWEVRKMSPGKSLSSSNKEKIIPSPTISRSLNFGQSQQTSGQRVASWADRVKGYIDSVPPPDIDIGPLTELPQPPAHNKQNTEKQNADKQGEEKEAGGVFSEDTEGWETVHRGGKIKRTLSGGSRSSISSLKAIDIKYPPPTPPIYPDTVPHPSPKTHKTNTKARERKRTDSDKENRSNDGIESTVIESPEDTDTNNDVNGDEDVVKEESEDVLMNEKQEKNGVENGNEFEEGIKKVDENEKKVDENEKKADENEKKVDENEKKVDEKEDGEETKAEENLADKSLTDDDAGTGEDTKDEELLEDALQSVFAEEDHLTDELVKENEAALAEASQEEQTYLQEIQRVQEQDCSPAEEEEEDLGTSQSSNVDPSSLDWDSILQQHDAECASGQSWGDMVEDEERTTGRTPGRVVHIHEKLSSPSRKRSPTESKKRHEEKQAKAHELREKLKKERSERVRMLTKKVEEVREYKTELLATKRDVMAHKLQRVEEKRQHLLAIKSRKAAQEETKANEIAFINTLEAQNKRHDIIVKHQESEARLHDIQEERQRKNEEKAAKEAAVEERRKALEAMKIARLTNLQEKKKEKEKEFEQRQQEKEKERMETARAKEKEREERIAALNKRQQDSIEELQKKIKLKQDESDKRHKERLEHIREKAFEMTIMRHSTEDHNDAPTHMPYDNKKLCGVCNVMIPSEVFLLSHLRGKKHQQALSDSSGTGKQLSKKEIESFNLKHIQDAPPERPDPKITLDKERQKALKKRCKKLRQRMTQRGAEYENALSSKPQTVESTHRAKLQKVVKDMSKYLQSQESGPWPVNKVAALDRNLGELARILEKQVSADQVAFRICGGMTAISRVLLVITAATTDRPTIIPNKSLLQACTVSRLACKACYDNCHYMLFSNKVGTLVDLLAHRLNLLLPDNYLSGICTITPTSSPRLPHDPLAASLMELLATLLGCLASSNHSGKSASSSSSGAGAGDSFTSRAADIVSYMVSVGIVDRLSLYFSSVRGHVDDDPTAAEFLQHSLSLLSAMTTTITNRNGPMFSRGCPSKEDTTQLLSTLRATRLMGLVSLMYGMLLHGGAPTRGEQAPPELPRHTVTVLTMGMRVLNHLALLNLRLLQSSLGEEGTSLELRHIASYLLWYCTHHSTDELLHEVILAVGYFTVLHLDNQTIIQSGQPPTVLQQLCCLPFQYFSDPRLTMILFPTLISCCYRSPSNTELLEHELSTALLANFIEEKNLEVQQSNLQMSPKLPAKNNHATEDRDARLGLAARFPSEEWTKAKHYFTSEKEC